VILTSFEDVVFLYVKVREIWITFEFGKCIVHAIFKSWIEFIYLGFFGV